MATLPTVDTYLEQLPGGPEAFEQFRTTITTSLVIRDYFDEHGTRPKHPFLQPLLRGAHDHERYIPATWVVAMMGALRDLHCNSEGELADLNCALSFRVYEDSFYRPLMKLLSPSLLVLGAARRWRAFFTDGELTASKVQSLNGVKSTEAVLKMPPHLFDRNFFAAMSGAFEASTKVTGARDAKSTMLEHSPSSARYRVSWSA